MFRRKKAKQQPIQTRPSLVLPHPDGSALMEFPVEVIDSVRRLVARVGRDSAFPERLALTSALRQEGTTFISRALAATLAHDLGATVCVVELNWWWPSEWGTAVSPTHSLASVLSGQASLDEAILHTGWPNLAVLPAGKIDATRRSMLAHSSVLRELIAELDARFDHLILDIPAILATNDAMPLASLASACSLVVRQGITSIEDTKSALDDIAHLEVLGIIMNQVELATPAALLKYIPQN
ncbi:MAG: CpsD/CapB family tyrosine-protein kinase [Chloroflexota bacterium]